MKRFLLIIATFSIWISSFAQLSENSYPFESRVVGEGSALIFIPGLASSSDVWKATVDSLKQYHQCHLLTLSGFAQQEPMQKVEDGFLPKIKEALVRYIKSELDEKPILVGHSLGGFLSMWIASEEVDLVKKIVIVDSYPFYSAAMNPLASEESSVAQASQFKQMMLNIPDSSFAQQQKMSMPSMISSSDKVNTAVQWSLQSDRKTVAQAMYELMTTDLREEVEQIKCPVLVMGSWYGGKDYGLTEEMVRTNYENQFSRTSDLRVEMAPTAKHFIMWDQPDWFMKQLITFIK